MSQGGPTNPQLVVADGRLTFEHLFCYPQLRKVHCVRVPMDSAEFHASVSIGRGLFNVHSMRFSNYPDLIGVSGCTTNTIWKSY